ncbi:unnamed protein product [marine sediment metagenome]|uniref:Uncharacterized protein n=1 Tax=marine sediment metagenome TaxID=412755 RepID=X1GFN5_9ZZZZ
MPRKRKLKRVISGKLWYSTYHYKYKLKSVAQSEIVRFRKKQKVIRKGARMHFRLLKSGKFWYVYYR